MLSLPEAGISFWLAGSPSLPNVSSQEPLRCSELWQSTQLLGNTVNHPYFFTKVKNQNQTAIRRISRCQGLEPGLHLASLRDRRSDWRMGAGEWADWYWGCRGSQASVHSSDFILNTMERDSIRQWNDPRHCLKSSSLVAGWKVENVAQRVKSLPAMLEAWVQSLGQDDPLEKKMATHSSTLAWKIPWTEKPSGLQSMGSQSQTRVRDFTFTFRRWRQHACWSLSLT